MGGTGAIVSIQEHRTSLQYELFAALLQHCLPAAIYLLALAACPRPSSVAAQRDMLEAEGDAEVHEHKSLTSLFALPPTRAALESVAAMQDPFAGHRHAVTKEVLLYSSPVCLLHGATLNCSTF